MLGGATSCLSHLLGSPSMVGLSKGWDVHLCAYRSGSGPGTSFSYCGTFDIISLGLSILGNV